MTEWLGEWKIGCEKCRQGDFLVMAYSRAVCRITGWTLSFWLLIGWETRNYIENLLILIILNLTRPGQLLSRHFEMPQTLFPQKTISGKRNSGTTVCKQKQRSNPPLNIQHFTHLKVGEIVNDFIVKTRETVWGSMPKWQPPPHLNLYLLKGKAPEDVKCRREPSRCPLECSGWLQTSVNLQIGQEELIRITPSLLFPTTQYFYFCGWLGSQLLVFSLGLNIGNPKILKKGKIGGKRQRYFKNQNESDPYWKTLIGAWERTFQSKSWVCVSVGGGEGEVGRERQRERDWDWEWISEVLFTVWFRWTCRRDTHPFGDRWLNNEDPQGPCVFALKFVCFSSLITWNPTLDIHGLFSHGVFRAPFRYQEFMSSASLTSWRPVGDSLGLLDCPPQDQCFPLSPWGSLPSSLVLVVLKEVDTSSSRV